MIFPANAIPISCSLTSSSSTFSSSWHGTPAPNAVTVTQQRSQGRAGSPPLPSASWHGQPTPGGDRQAPASAMPSSCTLTSSSSCVSSSWHDPASNQASRQSTDSQGDDPQSSEADLRLSTVSSVLLDSGVYHNHSHPPETTSASASLISTSRQRPPKHRHEPSLPSSSTMWRLLSRHSKSVFKRKGGEPSVVDHQTLLASSWHGRQTGRYNEEKINTEKIPEELTGDDRALHRSLPEMPERLDQDEGSSSAPPKNRKSWFGKLLRGSNSLKYQLSSPSNQSPIEWTRLGDGDHEPNSDEGVNNHHPLSTRPQLSPKSSLKRASFSSESISNSSWHGDMSQTYRQGVSRIQQPIRAVSWHGHSLTKAQNDSFRLMLEDKTSVAEPVVDVQVHVVTPKKTDRNLFDNDEPVRRRREHAPISPTQPQDKDRDSKGQGDAAQLSRKVEDVRFYENLACASQASPRKSPGRRKSSSAQANSAPFASRDTLASAKSPPLQSVVEDVPEGSSHIVLPVLESFQSETLKGANAKGENKNNVETAPTSPGGISPRKLFASKDDNSALPTMKKRSDLSTIHEPSSPRSVDSLNDLQSWKKVEIGPDASTNPVTRSGACFSAESGPSATAYAVSGGQPNRSPCRQDRERITKQLIHPCVEKNDSCGPRPEFDIRSYALALEQPAPGTTRSGYDDSMDEEETRERLMTQHDPNLSKICVLLLHVQQCKFELIQVLAHLKTDSVAFIIRTAAENCMTPLLREQSYAALYRPKDGIRMKRSRVPLGNVAGGWKASSGDILVAIPKGHSLGNCISMSRSVLRNIDIANLVKDD
jgi:hypothetical protein